MNFLTDLHLKELEEGNYLTYFDFEQAFSNYMFKPEGTEPIEDPAGTACSGFICRNENGEILLGRNFDGMEGPLTRVRRSCRETVYSATERLLFTGFFANLSPRWTE